eukprot:204552-Chlamydomonas_euryale.AAC.1
MQLFHARLHNPPTPTTTTTTNAAPTNTNAATKLHCPSLQTNSPGLTAFVHDMPACMLAPAGYCCCGLRLTLSSSYHEAACGPVDSAGGRGCMCCLRYSAGTGRQA